MEIKNQVVSGSLEIPLKILITEDSDNFYLNLPQELNFLDGCDFEIAIFKLDEDNKIMHEINLGEQDG